MSAEIPTLLQECGDCKNFTPNSVDCSLGICEYYKKYGSIKIPASSTLQQTHLRYYTLLREPEFIFAIGAMKRARRLTCFKPKENPV